MDKPINTGGPAFPRPYSKDTFNDETCLAQAGMTLRDWFAGLALNGWLASWDKSSNFPKYPSALAEDMYRMADAMLKQREENAHD